MTVNGKVTAVSRGIAFLVKIYLVECFHHLEGKTVREWNTVSLFRAYLLHCQLGVIICKDYVRWKWWRSNCAIFDSGRQKKSRTLAKSAWFIR